jgi:hypothetical protein
MLTRRERASVLTSDSAPRAREEPPLLTFPARELTRWLSRPSPTGRGAGGKLEQRPTMAITPDFRENARGP